jgi:hypothetical protein
MQNDYIDMGGRRVRVEANWNAFVTFCEIRGYDTLESIDMLRNFKMRDLAPLMWACVQEGEKTDGNEFSQTLEEFTAGVKPQHIAAFMPIYVKQTRQPDVPKAPESKPAAQKKSKLSAMFRR